MLQVTTINNPGVGAPSFALVKIGQPGWPVALMGPATGPNAKQNRQEAEFLASAPVMHDILKSFGEMFSGVDFSKPLSAEKIALMESFAERAKAVAEKHKGVN